MTLYPVIFLSDWTQPPTPALMALALRISSKITLLFPAPAFPGALQCRGGATLALPCEDAHIGLNTWSPPSQGPGGLPVTAPGALCHSPPTTQPEVRLGLSSLLYLSTNCHLQGFNDRPAAHSAWCRSKSTSGARGIFGRVG